MTIQFKFRRMALASMLLPCAISGAGEPVAYRHFDWQTVSDGVWFGTTRADSFQTGNTTIIALPTGGAMVVDSHNADFLAREILDKALAMTGGPVRYVVNTHLHQDHVGGNAVFRDAWPEVQILAHRNTCIGIAQKTMPRMQERLGPLRQQLQEMTTRAARLSADDKDAAGLAHRIAGTRLYLQDTADFRWVMPTQCLDLQPGQSKVIEDGGRRIEIDYFGRAHSTGDLVVFLPKERLLVMQDLWTQGTGSALVDSGMDGRDGSVLDYPQTLQAIRSLDFDTALTGHARVMHGKASLDAAIAFSTDMVARIRAREDRGDMVEEVLQRLPPPGDATPAVATRWRRVLISGFEEMEFRRQSGIPLPADAARSPP